MKKQIPKLKRAVFLDRDGVLNLDKGYVFKTEDLEILPDVVTSLAELKKRGFLLIVVTNQSGVARGMYDLNDVDIFHRHLASEIAKAGGPILDGFYTCPHHPNGTVSPFNIVCDCRKPKSELLHRAAAELGIDLLSSWMIGDKDSDAECAAGAGVRAILVQSKKYPCTNANAIQVKSLRDALSHII